jgi:flagellar basal body-associated protein FliL
MTERSVGRGVGGGLSSSVGRGMDKRKVCVFLILVVVGLLCLLLMAYMLFYASPHANSTIQNGAHSSLRLEMRASVHS